MIPLGADEVMCIWERIKGYGFKATHGLMIGMDIRGEDLRERVLESMQFQIRKMGVKGHKLLEEKV